MIFHLNLTERRKVRVWIDEAPTAAFESEKILHEIIKPAAYVNSQPRTGGAEVLAPKGPIGIYGMLGATFTPRASESLDVFVGVTSRVGGKYSESIALRSDSVSFGLPEDLATAALGGVVRALNRSGVVPSGDLVFNCAAYGKVGSTAALFEYLAPAVAQVLLSTSSHTETDLSPTFGFSLSGIT